MVNYKRIIRECFWDLNTTEENIKQVLSGSDYRKKKQLFEKILLNSTHYLLDLQLFNKNDLYTLLENYQIPQFNYDYAFRRKNIAEVFFLDKELKIGELQWTA